MEVNQHAAITAAFVGGACYLDLMRASKALSPRLCKAYSFLPSIEQQEWDTRWASIGHAIITSYLCMHMLIFTSMFSEHPNPGAEGALVSSCLRTTWLSHVTIGFSLGYFIVDCLVMALNPGLAGTEMFVHHCVAIFGLYTCFREDQGHIYMSGMLMTEVTTPFMNLRWLLEKGGAKSSPAYLYNGIAIVITWALFRIAMFVPYYLHVFNHWGIIVSDIRVHGIVAMVGVPAVLAVLNTVWFVKIVKGAAKLVMGTGGQEAAQPAQQKVQQKGQQKVVEQAQQEQVQQKVHEQAQRKVQQEKVQQKQAKQKQQEQQSVSAATGATGAKIRTGARAVPVVVVQAYASDRKHRHDE